MRNQIIYQTCTVIFNYNETDCRQLDDKEASAEIHVCLANLYFATNSNTISIDL